MRGSLIIPRHYLMIAAVTISALVLAACSSCTQTAGRYAGPPEKVTIAFATLPYTVLVDLAQVQGYFSQEGLEVTPVFHSTGKGALDNVLSGKADFATVAETPVMFAIMKGAAISVVASIQTSNRADIILVRKESGIKTPQDLNGKTIGVPLGTSMEFFMDAFLISHGIARKDVKVVNLRPEDMPTAIAKGDVDAISTFPPFLAAAQKRLGKKGVAFYDEEIYTQIFNIVSTREYVRSHPGTIRKLLIALIRAEDFLGQNPEEAQKIVAGFRKMDQRLLISMWPGNKFEVSLDQQLLLSLEDESRWAIKNRLTGGTAVPNYLDFMYLDGLTAVKPKAVRILR